MMLSKVSSRRRRIELMGCDRIDVSDNAATAVLAVYGSGFRCHYLTVLQVLEVVIQNLDCWRCMLYLNLQVPNWTSGLLY